MVRPASSASPAGPAVLITVTMTLVLVLALGAGTVGLDRRPVGDGSALPPPPDGVAAADSAPDAPARPISRPLGREPDAPIPVGTPEQPFAPLPQADGPRVVISPTGLALPIIEERPDGWLVSTPCQAVRAAPTGTAVGRAHVVIDPGHGGAEPGAVGPSGLVEKDLNLAVARRAAELLTEAGATVVLTRDGDHTMTAAARGLVARAVGPALLVSVHHNGGAPPGDGGPGTIVFTKADSPESTRFGGLYHRSLTPVLEEAAAAARERHRAWVEAIEAYDAAHQEYAAAHEAHLAAVAAAGESGESGTPPPAPAPEAPLPPEGEPVPEFRWAGSANAGVRSWLRADGADHLAILRHSGQVPAALIEPLYLTNPVEEALLAEPAFLDAEGAALAEAITRYLAGEQGVTGLVADQQGDQPIGGGGRVEDCIEPPLE